MSIASEMTPAELEAKRLEIEKQLIQLVKDKRRAKRLVVWKTAKTVLLPLVVVVGAVGFVVFGALFAVLGESLKKIYK